MDQLEQAAFQAWPCKEEILLSGWRLRFADGFTKRANSVNASSVAQALSEGDLTQCEQHYHQRGLTPVFRLTDTMRGHDTDRLLEARGYRHAEPSLVMLCPAPMDSANCSSIQSESAANWLKEYCRISEKSGPENVAHLALLKRLPPDTCFAVQLLDGQAASCALGVKTGSLTGIFEVATQASHQRQGLARALCSHIMAWGSHQGATAAYLQVGADNAAAIKLYDSLGFRKAYDYWYRIAPSPAKARA